MTRWTMAIVGLGVVAAAALPAVAEDLYVDAGKSPGNGSQASPYQTISAAVARARNDRLTRSVPDRETIVIHVRAGKYFGSYDKPGPTQEQLPIILDVPNLELRGDTVLTLDADGWPTGAMSGTETSFTAVSFLGGDFFPERFLFLVGPTSDRLTGADVTIGGFVLDGGTNGKKSNGACVGLDRVGGATIARNVITRTSHAVFARASTAVLRGNLIHDCYTGGILQAGSAASPSKYVFQDNRSVRHTEGGLVPQATGIVHVMDPALTPVPANALYDVNQVAVIHNDLSDSNAVKGWSTGIRCMMFTPALAAGQVPGHLTVDIKRNRIAGNSVGIHVDAGFPWRSFAEPLTATFRGEFADNEVTANDTAPALLTFTRNTTGLKQTPSELNWNKYLTDSLYELTVADDELEGFLYDNPTNDPVSGVALGNTLLVNGVELVGRNID